MFCYTSPIMMMKSMKAKLILVCLFLVACQVEVSTDEAGVASESEAGEQGDKVVTLLFTNDVESVYDPIEAHWLDDIERIGGIAEMTTLIENLRGSEPRVFLFDSGDIFTGALAKLTDGKLAFEATPN